MLNGIWLKDKTELNNLLAAMVTTVLVVGDSFLIDCCAFDGRSVSLLLNKKWSYIFFCVMCLSYIDILSKLERLFFCGSVFIPPYYCMELNFLNLLRSLLQAQVCCSKTYIELLPINTITSKPVITEVLFQAGNV